MFSPTQTNAQIDGVTTHVIKKSKLGLENRPYLLQTRALPSNKMPKVRRTDRRFPKSLMQSGTLQEEGSDTDHTGESTGDLVGGCGTGVLLE